MMTFSGIFAALNVDVNDMRTFLSGDDVAFLLVTSPAAATLAEAHFFQDKTKELGLPFRGFVLNRSRARNTSKPWPDENTLDEVSPEGKAALPRLQSMAHAELEAAKRDLALLTELEQRAGKTATAIAVPELPEGADDMVTLLTVADALAAS
jgi:hypothetical protein